MAVTITRYLLAHMLDDCIEHALEDGHSSFTMDLRLYENVKFRETLDEFVRMWNRNHKCHVLTYEPRYAAESLFWVTLSITQLSAGSPARSRSVPLATLVTSPNEVLGHVNRWSFVDW